MRVCVFDTNCVHNIFLYNVIYVNCEVCIVYMV